MPEWLGFLPTDISASWPLALAAEIFRTDDGRTNGNFSAGRTKIFGRSDGQVGGNLSDIRTAGRPNGRTDGRTKTRKNQSVSQTIDLIVTIKTHTGSSKSELSSRGKRPFKVYDYSATFSDALLIIPSLPTDFSPASCGPQPTWQRPSP